MEAGKFSENQPCEEETQEPDEQSGEEEEEHCLPLEETMAASWIAQIGEGLSVTEAVGLLHCHERVAHAYLGPGPGTEGGSTKGSRTFLIAYNSAKSCGWFPAVPTVNASVFDFHGR